VTGPDRWHHVERLYHDALARDAGERSAFLREACGDDEALRLEVESLLAYASDAQKFMDAPAIEIAAPAAIPSDTMSQTPVGRCFGPYEIGSLLGSGGMGEVYRARDTKLGRDVAIKILPRAFIADVDRRARFEREARLLAALNHPHIAAIYGFEDRDDVHALVLELVEGETLAERLARAGAGSQREPLDGEREARGGGAPRAVKKDRPIPIGEALTIAKQIAEALEAAHEKGIVHRDLKPANITIARDGVVKVLDFGLAKAGVDQSAPDITHSPTVTVGGTYEGVILGTAPYMSPEQARGKIVDKRTDIWAFGCVLYEMLAGRRAFAGDTVTDTLAAIIEREPDWTALPASTPPAVQRLIQRCLEKDPKRRLRDIGEARIELDDAVTTLKRVPSTNARRLLVAGAAAVVLLVVLGSGWLLLDRRGTPAARGPAEYLPLTNFADSATSPALSPDGRMLAFIRGQSTFAGPGQVYVKLLPDGEPVQLTRDDLPKGSPVFSRDGARIAYEAGRNERSPHTIGVDREQAGSSPFYFWSTWVVPVLGGEPTLLLANSSGLTWIPTGMDPPRILFSELRGKGVLMAIVTSTESRSESREVYVPASETGMAHRSYLSPDGKWVLLAEMGAGTWFPCRLVPYDGTSSGRRVGPSPAQCTDAAWSPDGNWMYFSTNTGSGYHIWRERFPNGIPEQVTSGATEEQGIAVAPDGRSLVTSVGTSQSTVWIHDSRGERQISSQAYGFLPSFSGDGKKLYYLLRSGGSRGFMSGELWVADLDSGQRRRLLSDFLMQHYGVSPNGARVVFVAADASGQSSVWVATLDGRSAPRRLTSMDAVRGALFGADDEVLFVGGQSGSAFLYRIKAHGSELQKVSPNPVAYLYGVSPGGRSVAVGSTQETQNSIVVYSVDGGSATTICTACATSGGPERGGSTLPLVSWSPDGKFLYLVERGQNGYTYALSLRPGQVLPALPASGIQLEGHTAAALPGARLIAQQQVFVGPNPSVYAFTRVTTQRNIYRILVP
jgi:eukaryotic-like serine/threonine-protein kinase